MEGNESIGVRHILGWVAMIVGAFVGWGWVELAWRFHNPHGSAGGHPSVVGVTP